MDGDITLSLNADEFALVKKLAETNDNNYGKRFGKLKTRVTLLGKLYEKADELGQADDDEDEGEQGD